MKVLIIGAGNMGVTYGRSFIQASVVPRDSLFFIDRNTDKAEALGHYSLNPLHTEPSPFVSHMDLIILSVKPQDFASLAASLAPYIRPTQLVLSVMAGIRLDSLSRTLGVTHIVRAMPNLPAQVGQGMTVFTTSQAVTRGEVLTIQNLLNTTGKTLYTADESMLDAATAISGSGPAFVYYYMQAMIQSAARMGFSESEARLLVSQTFLGALDLLQRDSLTTEAWIDRVASRGGTTEAALAAFERLGLMQSIDEGLEAARVRATVLSMDAGK
ncbi:MAG: pyrroline-5-carboxylate reductase [Bacteroidia bacterium]|nr:pyrroline-5-carboxylate reductase [Bacteroidia bacterium]